MDADLLKAVLAMDSYNRGYDEGIKNLGGIGSKIGNVTIRQQSDILQGTPGVSASFYGIAYKLVDGETVISYRGTDNIPADAFTGWAGGTGDPDTIQSDLALKFFKTVASSIAGITLTGKALKTVDISFTGHSLGGGLAGLIASIPSRRSSAVALNYMRRQMLK